MEEKVEKLNTEQRPKPSLFGMLGNPGEQFERIRNRPTIWGAMIMVTLITTIGMFLTFINMDMEGVMGEGVAAEQAAVIKTITTITGVVTGLFTPIISILISSAIILIIAKIAHSDVTFKQLFSLNTYTYLIPALGVLINGIIHMFIGGNAEIAVTSLAGLINSESSILSSIELFSIWQLILIGMGLHKVARLSKGVSWTIVIVFFLFQLGMGYVSGLLAGLGA
jgi:hypothetical protein